MLGSKHDVNNRAVGLGSEHSRGVGNSRYSTQVSSELKTVLKYLLIKSNSKGVVYLLKVITNIFSFLGTVGQWPCTP